MSNKTWIGSAVFVVVLVAAAVVLTNYFRKDEVEPALASDILKSAGQVQTELLDSVQPDSTLHVVFEEYDPSKVNVDPGPGWNPINTRKEWWAYFDGSGDAVAFRAETTDMDTGELIRVTEFVDGKLATTFSKFGESGGLDFGDWNIKALKQQLIEATNVSLNKVIVEANAPASEADVDGQDVYVIDEVRPEGVTRVFIDASDYRPVRVEIVKDGQVVNATAMPAYEFLDGNHVPDN